MAFTKKELSRIKSLRNKGYSWAQTAKTMKRRKADIISAVQRKPRSEYWRDVRSVRKALGLSYRDARQKVYDSEKWADRRAKRSGKSMMRWSDLWADIRKRNLDRQQSERYIKKVEKSKELWTE